MDWVRNRTMIRRPVRCLQPTRATQQPLPTPAMFTRSLTFSTCTVECPSPGLLVLTCRPSLAEIDMLYQTARLGLFAAWNYLAVPFKTTLNPVYLEIYSSNPRSANAVHSQRAAFVPLTCPMELTGQKHGSQGGDSCGTKRLNFYRFNIICKIR